MYRQKSEIIGQIQVYHNRVAQLYHDIYEQTDKEEIRTLVLDLYEHEKLRENYLGKHKKIAVVMNSWLDFPCDRLSNQISDCLKNIKPGSDLTLEELIKIELYFDDCLIKLYNILTSEDELNESIANIFYYMLKKTRKEQALLADMMCNYKNTPLVQM
jgi:hypothetical protein